MEKRQHCILAVSSGGGHWSELRRLRPAWAGCDVCYVTTSEQYRREVARDAPSTSGRSPRFYVVPDANQWNKLRVLWQGLVMARIVLLVRPDVVISTGAAPGYFAIRLGRLMGARTVWVDSIANAEELTLSGRMSGPYCDLFLTQWEHLANADGSPSFQGTVM